MNISVYDDATRAGPWWRPAVPIDRASGAPGKSAEAYSVHDDATVMFNRVGIVRDDAPVPIHRVGSVHDDATVVFAGIDDVGNAGWGEAAHPENDQRLVTLIDQIRLNRGDGAGSDGIAVMSLVELPRVRARLGFHASDQLRAQVETWIADRRLRSCCRLRRRGEHRAARCSRPTARSAPAT